MKTPVIPRSLLVNIKKIMNSVFKSGLLLLIVAIAGSPVKVLAHFSYGPSYNCADCHDDGRTWQSIHGGGPTPTPTPVPTPTPAPTPGPTIDGVYNGLVGNGTDTDMAAFFADNGFLLVTTKANGTFTGSLRLEGKSLPIKGTFSQAGDVALTVKRAPKSDATVALHYDKGTNAITGNVTTSGSPLDLTALPAVSQTAKRYTVVLPSPDATTFGHGYATLVVAANGTAVFAGKLSDGTAYTSTSRTVDDGKGDYLVPVHVPLYAAAGGMLTGEILLPKAKVNPTDADVVGTLEWLRPADSKAKVLIFQTGFLEAIDPVGGVYNFVKGTALITGGTFTLKADTLSLAGTWPASNVPLIAKPTKITFASATGVIKGSFCRTVGGKTVTTPYEGVILVNPLTVGTASLQGGGFFPTATGSAPVELTVP